MYIKENQNKNSITNFLIPFFALFSFVTWYLNIPEMINIGIYLFVLMTLIVFKVGNTTLLSFVLFSMMGNRTAMLTTSSGRPSTILFMVVLGAFILYYLIDAIVKKKFEKGKLTIPLIVITSYALLSLLWTMDVIGGLSEIGYMIFGYFTYFIIRNEKDDPVDFYKFSWLLTLILLVLSLQYFVITYKFLPLNNKSELVKGFWGYINAIATIIGILFVPSLYKYFAKNKGWIRYLYLPLEILVIYAIIVSLSDGLYVALIVSIPVILAMLVLKKRKYLFPLVIAGIIMFAVGITTVVLLKDTYPDIYNKLNKFSSSRIDLYRLALIQIKEPLTFIFGKGSGSTHLILEGHYKFYYFHSWFFELFVNRGIITVIMMFYVFYVISKILSSNNSKFRYFVAVGLITYLVHTLIDIGFEYQYLGVLFYLLVATVENSSDQQKITKPNFENLII